MSEVFEAFPLGLRGTRVTHVTPGALEILRGEGGLAGDGMLQAFGGFGGFDRGS